MAKRDRPRFVHRGHRKSITDTYHYLLGMAWGRFLVLILVLYVAFNVLFAGLYTAGGDCINASDPDSFLLAFSFSVQTMASLGYGAMHPTTPWSHLVTIVEAFLGLIVTAMVTGLMFAKFARPAGRIGFSQNALVGDMNGVPTFHFRMANARLSQVVDARVDVTLLVEELTEEGLRHRRFVTLDLVRDYSPAFSIAWTVMHRVDESSPLWCGGESRLPGDLVSIIVNVIGVDNMFAQTVHAQHFYYPEQIRFHHRFVDMLEFDVRDQITVHHDRLHEHEPIG